MSSLRYGLNSEILFKRVSASKRKAGLNHEVSSLLKRLDVFRKPKRQIHDCFIRLVYPLRT